MYNIIYESYLEQQAGFPMIFRKAYRSKEHYFIQQYFLIVSHSKVVIKNLSII